MATQKKTGAQPAKKQTAAARAKGGSANTAPAARNTRQTEKKPAARKAEEHTERERSVRERRPADSSRLIHQLIPYIFGVFAVIFIVFLAVRSNEAAGMVGGFLRKLSFGLFGYGAWLIPVLLLLRAVTWKKNIEDGTAGGITALSAGLLVIFSALLHTMISKVTPPTFNIKLLFGAEGITPGGVLGGLLSNLLVVSIQKVATYILLIFGALILFMFTMGLTPHTILLYLRYRHAVAREKAEERAEERSRANAEREAKYVGYSHYRDNPAEKSVPAADARQEQKKKKRRGLLPDQLMPNGTDEEEIDEIPDSAVTDAEVPQDGETQQGSTYVEPDRIHLFNHPTHEEKAKDDEPEEKEEDKSETLDPIIPEKTEELIGDLDLRNILIPPEAADALPEMTVEDENVGGTVKRRIPVVLDDTAPWDEGSDALAEELLNIETSPVGEEEIPPEPKPKPTPRPKIYRFPPINLLSKAEPVDRSGREEELQANSRKLVETLDSFRVHTRILSVSQGPTITRYELVPEAGIKVRSIANLVDDISLNLAASGVRIEAPIPGKAAVGIEVPNKTVETVHLRELIDTPAFKNAESKVNVALGMDVAGTPVYCNLAKMPHLLIAGATGMGKSVCINSIISSILYKAMPDEVKLILIDPKKVELNKYNGLPQLLIPVVSDPQKAAGALNWAVSEMERRFNLIDEVGTRDITGYNKIAADDPDREKMPYVVIIIDELADLMMTAPDAVETSICRLAQKARAAGMHLVIGTQRPSVDVITGLIKANIPSRIAFTVASQVDSKTIIDIGGAEKLIGRGDMLYAPVGLMKPLRVQGAFVSDGEVEAICDFIRDNIGQTEYDNDIIESIEKEAARCVQHAKGGDFGDDMDDEPQENVDPKFREALELAVNAGKISTSLLQRHLSLGYGRAAKIIDRMQALGYVSPPEGTKPRDVLLTKQMYMEMIVNKENI